MRMQIENFKNVYQDPSSVEAAAKEDCDIRTSERTSQVEGQETRCRNNPNPTPGFFQSSNHHTDVLIGGGEEGNVGNVSNEDEKQTNLHIGKLLPSPPLS